MAVSMNRSHCITWSFRNHCNISCYVQYQKQMSCLKFLCKLFFLANETILCYSRVIKNFLMWKTDTIFGEMISPVMQSPVSE